MWEAAGAGLHCEGTPRWVVCLSSVTSCCTIKMCCRGGLQPSKASLPFLPVCCKEGGERPCGRLLCAVTTSLLLQSQWSGGGELLRWLEMEVRWLIFTHEAWQGLLAKHKSLCLLHKWLLTNVFLVSLLFLFSTEEGERITLGINAGLGSFRWSWRFAAVSRWPADWLFWFERFLNRKWHEQGKKNGARPQSVCNLWFLLLWGVLNLWRAIYSKALLRCLCFVCWSRLWGLTANICLPAWICSFLKAVSNQCKYFRECFRHQRAQL